MLAIGDEDREGAIPSKTASAISHRAVHAWLSGIFVALFVLVSTGCESEPTARRVLIVGIDGATLEVIAPLLGEGRLPHLARIAEDGVHGVLRSELPLKSPPIWTTIATGKNPSGHGITNFTVDQPDGTARLVTSSDRKGHALWNIVSDRGRSVATVNWWVTHPPERIDGVMVSDHFLPSVVRGRERFLHAESGPTGPVVYPAEWAPRIQEQVITREAQAYETAPFANEPLPDWANREKLNAWFYDDASVGRVALEIIAGLEPDVMMVLFKGVDAASHVLYATLFSDQELPTPLRVSHDERAAGRRVLQRYYEQIDAWLGRMLEHYGPEDLVVVVSDHGFQVSKHFRKLTGRHDDGSATEAILFARGDGVAPGRGAGEVHVRDITPTVLHWLGLPVAQDMDGRPAAFLRRGEPTLIASYDVTPIERVGTGRTGAEAQIMEQLEMLGYFESEDEGAQPPPARSRAPTSP